MIHNGLNLSMNADSVEFNNCCLSGSGYAKVKFGESIWDHKMFVPHIEKNKKNIWDPDCRNCQSLENSNRISFRQSMLEEAGEEERLSGPRRIDLNFSRSCNLACRICGEMFSTYWTKHLKENNIPIYNEEFSDDKFLNGDAQKVIDTLKSIDLSNLRFLKFAGGETLLGNDYWKICEYLATLPHAKESLTISFQSNGTQVIPKKRHELLEKFHLIKLHFSIDGIEERFNYQRWPAEWNQVSENLLSIRENAPGNVMFLLEETISIFNLAYISEVAEWKKRNFDTNKEGDITDHTHHLAHGVFRLANCTKEYVDAMKTKGSMFHNMIPGDWKEDAASIENMINKIKQFDQVRNQKFEDYLPEVASFYSRYL